MHNAVDFDGVVSLLLTCAFPLQGAPSRDLIRVAHDEFFRILCDDNSRLDMRIRMSNKDLDILHLRNTDH